jgi:hypothetical protein
MDYSSEELNVSQIILQLNVLKYHLMKILEEEADKPESSIDSNKLSFIVKALDLIDGLINIPEEFSKQNFIQRFYQNHPINPGNFIYQDTRNVER